MRLRILTNRAHSGHQYELWRLPHDIIVADGLGDPLDRWDYERRPLRPNVKFINYRQIDLRTIDFVIMHFDESSSGLRHPCLAPNWGTAFRWLINNTRNIPRAAICHGTPKFKEMGKLNNPNVTIIENERQKVVDYLGDTLVVCNSNQARREWKFNKSKTIWHGFDPKEFYPSQNINNKVLSTNILSVKGRPHYRGFWFLQDILKRISPNVEIAHTETPRPKTFGDRNDYAAKKYEIYRSVLRNYSIFLNSTILSPMPRCRGEAMMSGLIPVTHPSHDADMFVTNHVNGFCSSNPEEVANFLNYLVNNPAEIERMSNASRETALEKFHIERYLGDWVKTIDDILKKNFFVTTDMSSVVENSRKILTVLPVLKPIAIPTRKYSPPVKTTVPPKSIAPVVPPKPPIPKVSKYLKVSLKKVLVRQEINLSSGLKAVKMYLSVGGNAEDTVVIKLLDARSKVVKESKFKIDHIENDEWLTFDFSEANILEGVHCLEVFLEKNSPVNIFYDKTLMGEFKVNNSTFKGQICYKLDYGEKCESIVGEIFSQNINFKIKPQADNLNILALRIGTYGRVNNYVLNIKIKHQNKTVREFLALTNKLKDNEHNDFKFNPISDSCGKTYDVELTPINGKKGKSITVYYFENENQFNFGNNIVKGEVDCLLKFQ